MFAHLRMTVDDTFMAFEDLSKEIFGHPRAPLTTIEG
jgi:hypothetical protein